MAGRDHADTGTAARIAGGSGIVFGGGLVDRGLRWVGGLMLSWVLGPAGLGVYQTAARLMAAITAFSPVGLDTAVVLFAARYRKSGERARLKGTVLAGLVLSTGMGVLAAAGTWAAARWGPWWPDAAVRAAVLWSAPAVALWTPLLFLVGALRAAKDMRGSALAYQVALPAAILALQGLLVALAGMGVRGAVHAFVIAHGLALAVAARVAWRQYGDVLRDRSLRAAIELRALLGFSIPQSLTAAAFQLNLQMDILMLAWLAGSREVGLYYVASSLASFGAVPANAVTSVFNPFIAELVYAGEVPRLERLLRTVTRWLVVVSAPVYLVLFLVPGLVLGVYDEAFAVSAGPLVVLAVGQAIGTACAPAMRVIPMSGHSLLNLANGVASLGLGLVLNWILIPRHGALGAAAASALTITAWSAWRLAEVWWMLRLFPFDRATGVLLGVAISGGVLARWSAASAGVGAQVGATAAVLAAFAVAVGILCRTPEDREVVRRVRARVGRRRG